MPGSARAGRTPAIELELDAQVELRRDLGAVGIADLGPAHGAEQDGVRFARRSQRGGGQGLAGCLEVLRAGRVRGEAQAEVGALLHLLEDGQRGVDDIDADAVAGQHADVEGR